LEREAAEKPFPDERLVTREANGKTVLEPLANASTMPESSKLIWKEKRRKTCLRRALHPREANGKTVLEPLSNTVSFLLYKS
jgi:hypothetical protein